MATWARTRMSKNKKTKNRDKRRTPPVSGARAGAARELDGMAASDVPFFGIRPQAELLADVARQNPSSVMAMKSNGDMFQELLAEYNAALVERGLAKSRDALEAMDTIDIRGIAGPRMAETPSELPSPSAMLEPDTYLAYIASEPPLYQILPCFEKGVIRANMDRYFEFELLSVDTDARELRVFLHDYTYRRTTGLWEPGVYGNLTLMYGLEDAQVSIKGADSDLVTFDRIYRMLDLKSLGWDNARRTLWKRTAVAHADAHKAARKSEARNDVVELARIFLAYVTICNFYLATRKPVAAKRRAPGKARTGKDAQNRAAAAPPPERLVRTVGPIRIVSARVPRPAGALSNTLRRYRVAEWTSRGHVRHYKTGKTVWIRPATHKRKALSGTAGQAPRPTSVVKFDPVLSPAGRNEISTTPHTNDKEGDAT